MTQTLSVALTDVRRAYRLLWGYQKRILHIVTLIREQLGFVPDQIDFKFELPDDAIQAPDNWMWDALPFSLIGFESTDGTDSRKIGARLLYIDVISDTGLHDEKARGGGNWEPNPARLPPPEECRSELRLYLLENPRNRRGEIYWHEEVVEKVYHWNPDAKAYDDKGGGVRIYGERIDLSELGTPEELANRVERFRVNADRELAAIAGR